MAKYYSLAFMYMTDCEIHFSAGSLVFWQQVSVCVLTAHLSLFQILRMPQYCNYNKITKIALNTILLSISIEPSIFYYVDLHFSRCWFLLLLSLLSMSSFRDQRDQSFQCYSVLFPQPQSKNAITSIYLCWI